MSDITLTVPVNGTEITFQFRKPDWATIKAAHRCIANSGDKMGAGEIFLANCIKGDGAGVLEADTYAKASICMELVNQVNEALPEVKASTP